MVDLSGQLHVTYWNSSNHIIHQAYTYTYASNTLTAVGSATQVDSNGQANHPALAVSPNDNSVTVAWVSEANNPTGNILARTRSAAGTWGAVESVSISDAWTSASAGINIDQGPSLLIDSNGAKYLSYIEDYDSSGSYGRIHFASNTGTWQDAAVSIFGNDPNLVINGSTYSHDPAVAINANGQLYIIGHGPTLTNVNKNMYTMQRNGDGTWAVPSLFANGSNANDFDASPSVKWSAIGNNRPNTYEFVFFKAPNGQYNNAQLYYGRFGDISTPVSTEAAPLRNYYTTTQPTLTWNSISWATAYEVDVDQSSTFSVPLDYTTVTSSPSILSATTSILTDGTTYYWRVRAKKSDGTWGNWSITETFSVDAP